MENELNKQDLDKLIDSVDVWENHSHLVLQSHDAMRTMYTDPEQLAEFDSATKDKRQALIKEVRVKRDQAIILKYKLVKAKESIQVEDALEKLAKGIEEQDNGKTDGNNLKQG
jgi:hypothetical protein